MSGPKIYLVQDGILMITNNGADKDTTPMISFQEFLLDLYNGTAHIFGMLQAFEEFKRMIQQMEQNDMSRLPDHMKELFLKDVQAVFRKTREAYEGFVKDHDVHKRAKDSTNKCVVCEKVCNDICAKCKLTYYCSREHQTAHWEEHKATCKVLRKFKDDNYMHETTLPNV